MAMSKRDYERIALRISAHYLRFESEERCLYEAGYTDGSRATAKGLASDLADVLKADNPRFDRARFLKACGIGEGE